MSTRKSLFFSFLDRYASLAITIVSSMVLARLLTPAEIGVFSVTTVLLMFANTVRDLGAGQYLVQEKELTTERIRAVWAVQLGLGLAMACVVLLASYPVSVFYNEPRMFNIMLVVALNYAINPFGSLTYAWLTRQMMFKHMAVMRFFAALAGAVSSILLAWQQCGPISLAIGSVVATVINASIALVFRPKDFPWLPGLREIRRVLAFGTKLTGSTLISVLSNSLPELLLGKMQGLTAAGLFSRAMGLVLMFYRLFSDAVIAVCLPWFAAQTRKGESIQEPFLKATSYLTALGWSFCLIVIFFAHPIIRLMYGSQWDESIDLARLLALAVGMSVPANLCQTALVSQGAATTVAKVTVQVALQNIVLVTIGVAYGLKAACVALIFASFASACVWLRSVLQLTGLPVGALLSVLARSSAVVLATAVVPTLVLVNFGSTPASPFMPLLLGISGGVIGLLIGIIFFKHPLHQELILARSFLK